VELGVTDAHGAPLTKMGRGALRVRVAKRGFPVEILVAHLKSKLLSFDGGFSTTDEALRAKTAALAIVRRTAEAATVRAAANALVANDNGAAVAVLGDFNDGPEAATTQILQGPNGSELGTRGFDAPDPGDRARLWNLSSLIPEERRYSRIHRGQGELLDQIFVSEEFFRRDHGKARRLPVSVDSRVENLRSIGDDPNAEPPSARPDHAPVTAVFELPPVSRRRRRPRT
jgi:endonuclease/exonuclease/phosphatase family metal-dependent hydrolase